MPRRQLAARVAAFFSPYFLDGEHPKVKRQDQSSSFASIDASPSGQTVENSSSPEPTTDVSLASSGTSSTTEIASTSPSELSVLPGPSQSLPPPAPVLTTLTPPPDVTSTSASPNPSPSSEPNVPPVADTPDVPSVSQSNVVQVPNTTVSIPTPSLPVPSTTPGSPEPSSPLTPEVPEPSLPPAPGPVPTSPESPEPSPEFSGVAPSILPSQEPSPTTLPLTPSVLTTDPVALTGNLAVDFSSVVQVPNNPVSTDDVPVLPAGTPTLGGIAINNAGVDEAAASTKLALSSIDIIGDLPIATQLAINAENTDIPRVFTEEIATVVPSIAADGSVVSVTVSTIRTRTSGVAPTVVATTEPVPVSASKGPPSRAAVIGGSIAGIVAFLLLGVFLLVILRRRASRRKALSDGFIFPHSGSSSRANPFNSEPSMMERGRVHPDGRTGTDPFQSPDREESLLKHAQLRNPFDDPPSLTKPWMPTYRLSGASWEHRDRTSQVSVGVAV